MARRRTPSSRTKETYLFRGTLFALCLLFSFFSPHLLIHATLLDVDVSAEAAANGGRYVVRCAEVATTGLNLTSVTADVIISGCDITTTDTPGVAIHGGLGAGVSLTIINTSITAVFTSASPFVRSAAVIATGGTFGDGSSISIRGAATVISGQESAHHRSATSISGVLFDGASAGDNFTFQVIGGATVHGSCAQYCGGVQFRGPLSLGRSATLRIEDSHLSAMARVRHSFALALESGVAVAPGLRLFITRSVLNATTDISVAAFVLFNATIDGSDDMPSHVAIVNSTLRGTVTGSQAAGLSAFSSTLSLAAISIIDSTIEVASQADGISTGSVGFWGGTTFASTSLAIVRSTLWVMPSHNSAVPAPMVTWPGVITGASPQLLENVTGSTNAPLPRVAIASGGARDLSSATLCMHDVVAGAYVSPPPGLRLSCREVNVMAEAAAAPQAPLSIACSRVEQNGTSLSSVTTSVDIIGCAISTADVPGVSLPGGIGAGAVVSLVRTSVSTVFPADQTQKSGAVQVRGPLGEGSGLTITGSESVIAGTAATDQNQRIAGVLIVSTQKAVRFRFTVSDEANVTSMCKRRCNGVWVVGTNEGFDESVFELTGRSSITAIAQTLDAAGFFFETGEDSRSEMTQVVFRIAGSTIEAKAASYVRGIYLYKVNCDKSTLEIKASNVHVNRTGTDGEYALSATESLWSDTRLVVVDSTLALDLARASDGNSGCIFFDFTVAFDSVAMTLDNVDLLGTAGSHPRIEWPRNIAGASPQVLSNVRMPLASNPLQFSSGAGVIGPWASICLTDVTNGSSTITAGPVSDSKSFAECGTVNAGLEAAAAGVTMLRIVCPRVASGVTLRNMTCSVLIDGCSIDTTDTDVVVVDSDMSDGAVLYVVNTTINATFTPLNTAHVAAIRLSAPVAGQNCGVVLSGTSVTLTTQDSTPAAAIWVSVSTAGDDFHVVVANMSAIDVTSPVVANGVTIRDLPSIGSRFRLHVTQSSITSRSTASNLGHGISLWPRCSFGPGAEFLVEDSDVTASSALSDAAAFVARSAKISAGGSLVVLRSNMTAASPSASASAILFDQGDSVSFSLEVVDSVLNATAASGATALSLTPPTIFNKTSGFTFTSSLLVAEATVGSTAVGLDIRSEIDNVAITGTTVRAIAATYHAAAVAATVTLSGRFQITESLLQLRATTSDTAAPPGKKSNGGVVFFGACELKHFTLDITNTTISTLSGTEWASSTTAIQWPTTITNTSKLSLSDVKAIGRIKGVAVTGSGGGIQAGTKLCLYKVFLNGAPIMSAPHHFIATCLTVIDVGSLPPVDGSARVSCAEIGRGVELVRVTQDVLIDSCVIHAQLDPAVVVSEGISANVTVRLQNVTAHRTFPSTLSPDRVASVVINGSIGEGAAVDIAASSITMEAGSDDTAAVLMGADTITADSFSLRVADGTTLEASCVTSCRALLVDRGSYGNETTITVSSSTLKGTASNVGISKGISFGQSKFGRNATVLITNATINVAGRTSSGISAEAVAFGPNAAFTVISSRVTIACDDEGRAVVLQDGSVFSTIAVTIEASRLSVSVTESEAYGVFIDRAAYSTMKLAITSGTTIHAKATEPYAKGVMVSQLSSGAELLLDVSDATISADSEHTAAAIAADRWGTKGRITIERSVLEFTARQVIPGAAITAAAILFGDSVAFTPTAFVVRGSTLIAGPGTATAPYLRYILWPSTVDRSAQRLENVLLSGAAKVPTFFGVASSSGSVSSMAPLCLLNVTADTGAVVSAPASFTQSCQAFINVTEEAIVDRSDGSASLTVGCDRILNGVRLFNFTANVTIDGCVVSSVDEPSLELGGERSPNTRLALLSSSLTTTINNVIGERATIYLNEASTSGAANVSLDVVDTNVTFTTQDYRGFGVYVVGSTFGDGLSITLDRVRMNVSCGRTCIGVILRTTHSGQHSSVRLARCHLTVASAAHITRAIILDRVVSAAGFSVEVVESTIDVTAVTGASALRLFSTSAPTVSIIRTNATVVSEYGQSAVVSFDDVSVASLTVEGSALAVSVSRGTSAGRAVELDGTAFPDVRIDGSTLSSTAPLDAVALFLRGGKGAHPRTLAIKRSTLIAKSRAAVAVLFEAMAWKGAILCDDSDLSFRGLALQLGRSSGAFIADHQSSFDPTVLTLRDVRLVAMPGTRLSSNSTFIAWPPTVTGSAWQTLDSVRLVGTAAVAAPFKLSGVSNVSVSPAARLCIRDLASDSSAAISFPTEFTQSCQAFINVTEEAVVDPRDGSSSLTVECDRIPNGVRLLNVTANVTIDGCTIDTWDEAAVWVPGGLADSVTLTIVRSRLSFHSTSTDDRVDQPEARSSVAVSGPIGTYASLIVRQTFIVAKDAVVPGVSAVRFFNTHFRSRSSVIVDGCRIRVRCGVRCIGVNIQNTVVEGREWALRVLNSTFNVRSQTKTSVGVAVDIAAAAADKLALLVDRSTFIVRALDVWAVPVVVAGPSDLGTNARVAFRSSALQSMAHRASASVRFNTRVAFGSNSSVSFDSTNMTSQSETTDAHCIQFRSPLFGSNFTVVVRDGAASSEAQSESASSLAFFNASSEAGFTAAVDNVEMAVNATTSTTAIHVLGGSWTGGRFIVNRSRLSFVSRGSARPGWSAISGAFVSSNTTIFHGTTVEITDSVLTALPGTSKDGTHYVVWPWRMPGRAVHTLSNVALRGGLERALLYLNVGPEHTTADIGAFTRLCLLNVTADAGVRVSAPAQFPQSCQAFINVTKEAIVDPRDGSSSLMVQCDRISNGVRLFNVTANVTIDGCSITPELDAGVQVEAGIRTVGASVSIRRTSITSLASQAALFLGQGQYANNTGVTVVDSVVQATPTATSGIVYLGPLLETEVGFFLRFSNVSIAAQCAEHCVSVRAVHCRFGPQTVISLSSCHFTVTSTAAKAEGLHFRLSAFGFGSVVSITNTVIDSTGEAADGLLWIQASERAPGLPIVVHGSTIAATARASVCRGISMTSRSVVFLEDGSFTVEDSVVRATTHGSSAAAVVLAGRWGRRTHVVFFNTTLSSSANVSSLALRILITHGDGKALVLNKTTVHASAATAGACGLCGGGSTWQGPITIVSSTITAQAMHPVTTLPSSPSFVPNAVIHWGDAVWSGVRFSLSKTTLRAVATRPDTAGFSGLVWPANITGTSPQVLDGFAVSLPTMASPPMRALVLPPGGNVTGATICLRDGRVLNALHAAVPAVAPKRFTTADGCGAVVSRTPTLSATPTQEPTKTVLVTPPPDTPRPAAVPAQAREAADVASGVASVGGVVSPLTAVVAVRGAVMARASDCGDAEAPMPDWPTLAAPMGWLFSTGDWGVMGSDIGAVLGNGLVLIIPVLVMLLVGEAVHLLTPRNVFESAEVVLKYGGDVLVTLTIALLSPSTGAAVAIVAVEALGRPDLPVSSGNMAFAAITLAMITLVCLGTTALLLWGWRRAVDMEASKDDATGVDDEPRDYNQKFSFDRFRHVTAKDATRAALGSGEWRAVLTLSSVEKSGFLLWLAIVGDGRVPHHGPAPPYALLAPFHRLWRYGGWWVAIVELSVSVLHGIAAGLARAGHCTIGPWMALVTQAVYVAVLITVPLAPAALWAVLLFVQAVQLLALGLGFIDAGGAANSVGDAADILDVALPFLMLLVPVIVAAARVLRCKDRQRRERRAALEALEDPLMFPDTDKYDGRDPLDDDQLEELLPLPHQAQPTENEGLDAEVKAEEPASPCLSFPDGNATPRSASDLGVRSAGGSDVVGLDIDMLQGDQSGGPHDDALMPDLAELLHDAEGSEEDSFDNGGNHSDDLIAALTEAENAEPRRVDPSAEVDLTAVVVDAECKEYSRRHRASGAVKKLRTRHSDLIADDPYLRSDAPARTGLEHYRVVAEAERGAPGNGDM